MHKIWEFIKSIGTYSMSITTLIFTFVPESFFTYGFITVDWEQNTIILCNRVLILLVVIALVGFVQFLFFCFRKSVTIGNNRYTIVVEYADIFDKDDCKKVIPFDECYTTHVGDAPHEIKYSSICGQFLDKNRGIDICGVIRQVGLTKQRKHSAFQSMDCYESGKLLPYDDFLLMSFAKLDVHGLAHLTRAEYMRCLEVLWAEIDKYYAGKSVAIPILCSGLTRFGDEMLTQQQLLDIIIASYKMSPNKIKRPAELHIVCSKCENFSFNKIGDYI